MTAAATASAAAAAAVPVPAAFDSYRSKLKSAETALTFVRAEHRKVLDGLHEEIRRLQQKCAGTEREREKRYYTRKQKEAST